MGHQRWEDFAQEDAEFYIYSVDVDYSTPEGKRFFFESGQEDAEKILTECKDLLRANGSAIEIGCGVGRLAIAMAKRFDNVVGVDVSPTMIEKFSKNADQLDVVNVSGFLDTQEWDKPGSADLIYSYIVFQHIEDEAVIEEYLPRISRALKAEGLSLLQFDTRPSDPAYRLKMLIPDMFLPRTLRRGIRRIRRDPDRLRTLFNKHGLRVLKESRPGTEDHMFLLGRA